MMPNYDHQYPGCYLSSPTVPKPNNGYWPNPVNAFRRAEGQIRNLMEYGSLSGASTGATSMLELSMGTGSFHQSVVEMRAGLQNGDLIEAFRQLNRQCTFGTTDCARRPVNEPKNRYWNVVPYDHNRVVLNVNDAAAPPPEPQRDPQDNDYVNASYVAIRIPDLDLQNLYICTQAPKPETVNDFWRLVWQERVRVIVMLTDVMEQTVNKCEAYWPALNDTLELRGGRIVVSCTSVQPPSRSRAYTVRELFIVDLHSSDQLSVALFQLHGWPDHGRPKEMRRILEMWRAIRDRVPEQLPVQDSTQIQTQTPPILVHCSAGVGRSGAYILMETLIMDVESETPLRPIEIVESMRQQRMAMVQTDEQFVFACQASLVYYEHMMQRRGCPPIG